MDMADRRDGERGMTRGEAISTFTFLLFGLLLGLAALAEPAPGKAAVLGLCALTSLAGAARFRIAAWAARRRGRR
jgi:hypothetical protein